jgi:hypothetical protein
MGTKSEGEEIVARWLTEAGIPFTREWRFHPVRRWRFDFALGGADTIGARRMAIEVEGGQWTGGHKRGDAADSDCEKLNEATLRGWRVLRFTSNMIRKGDGWQEAIHNLWNGVWGSDQPIALPPRSGVVRQPQATSADNEWPPL